MYSIDERRMSILNRFYSRYNEYRRANICGYLANNITTDKAKNTEVFLNEVSILRQRQYKSH